MPQAKDQKWSNYGRPKVQVIPVDTRHRPTDVINNFSSSIILLNRQRICLQTNLLSIKVYIVFLQNFRFWLHLIP